MSNTIFTMEKFPFFQNLIDQDRKRRVSRRLRQNLGQEPVGHPEMAARGENIIRTGRWPVSLAANAWKDWRQA